MVVFDGDGETPQHISEDPGDGSSNGRPQGSPRAGLSFRYPMRSERNDAGRPCDGIKVLEEAAR